MSLLNQKYIHHYLNKLAPCEQEQFQQQLARIDFIKLEEMMNHHSFNDVDQLQPIPYDDKNQFTSEEKSRYIEKGWDLIKQGQVGVLVVAGGQGTRLGHNGPKGTFPLQLPKGPKSLFQLQGEQLLRIYQQEDVAVPWLIMTSPQNHEDTVNHFNKHDYFGYPEEHVIFFQQHTMPAVDHDGRLLFSAPAQINFTPSGNGECFASLYHSGVLTYLKKKNIQWLFQCNVDNVLVQLVDPLFIGYAEERQYPIATKVVQKLYADEKVGIICLNHNCPCVVEYSELPESLRYMQNDSGGLLYGLGNISMHLFKLSFIEKHALTPIPYHKVSKIIPYIDLEGQLQQPTEPNGYKFERFIFDFFSLAEHIAVLKVDRDEEFAPIKNRRGIDSPETAIELLINRL